MNLTVTMTTSDAVYLQWDVPYPQILPTMYNISYSYVELSGPQPESDSASILLLEDGNSSVIVEGLLPFANHTFFVVAFYGDANDSSAAVNTTAQTDEDSE